MACDNEPTPGPRRHRSLFSWLVLAVVVLGVLAAYHYRFHLLWQYKAAQLGLRDVHAIPDRTMCDAPTPAEWVRCRVGCVELSLPPDLAESRIVRKDDSVVLFQQGARAVIVAVPTDTSGVSGILATASECCPEPQRFTMPKLRRACYQVGSDDFRWSMTPEEARWHAFRVAAGKLIRANPGGHTESMFREDLDGILHIAQRGVFEWQSNKAALWGYIHFVDREEKSDPTWMQAVCQSLTVSDTPE